MGDYFVVSLDKNIGKEIEMGHGFTHKEDAETYIKFLQNKEKVCTFHYSRAILFYDLGHCRDIIFFV